MARCRPVEPGKTQIDIAAERPRPGLAVRNQSQPEAPTVLTKSSRQENNHNMVSWFRVRLGGFLLDAPAAFSCRNPRTLADAPCPQTAELRARGSVDRNRPDATRVDEPASAWRAAPQVASLVHWRRPAASEGDASAYAAGIRLVERLDSAAPVRPPA